MVANPARGQLNREIYVFPVPVRARESGAHSRDFSAFRDRVHIYRQLSWGQSRVNQATQLRTDSVYCWESTGTWSVVLKVVLVTGAAFSGITMDQF